MIASKTGTALQPELTRKQPWIEIQLQSAILRAISINISKGRTTDLTIIFNHLNLYIKTLASTGNLDRAFDLIENASSMVANSFTLAGQQSSSISDLENLTVIECIASLPITIALALAQHYETTGINLIAALIKNIDWTSRDSLYSAGLPLNLLPSGDWLLSRLSLESAFEGRIISPYWYQKDIINLNFAKNLANDFKLFAAGAIKFYETVSDIFKGDSQRWLLACVQSREHEFWFKADRTQRFLKERWDEAVDSRVLEGLRWPTLPEEHINSIILERRHQLLQSISKQALLLIPDTPDNHPDYLGQFSFIIGEAFLTALCSNNHKTSSSIFKSYAMICLSRFEKLKPPPGTTHGVEESFKIAAACLLDLIELSGCARLLSELHQNDYLWRSVESFWSKLAELESGPTILEYIKLVILLNGNGFGIPLRGEIRFEWERKIWDQLSTLEIEQTHTRRSFSTTSKFVHASPLIRSINVDRHAQLPSGYNLFIVSWYLDKVPSSDIDLTWEQKDLLKILSGKPFDGKDTKNEE
jgi:hypothetical protein